MDKPILFSGPMVRALLEGRKTQTRRMLKPQPEPFRLKDGALCDVYLMHIEGDEYPRIALGDGRCGVITEQEVRCTVGDRLWVREAVAAYEREDGLDGLIYRADGAFLPIENTQAAGDRWGTLFNYRGRRGVTVPPIHMPRWASRITLVVTDVRVERVNDISRHDAVAEGATSRGGCGFGRDRLGWSMDWSPIGSPSTVARMLKGAGFFGRLTAHDIHLADPQMAFAAYWNRVAAPVSPSASWEMNPWVAAYTVTVHHGNIDRLEVA